MTTRHSRFPIDAHTQGRSDGIYAGRSSDFADGNERLPNNLSDILVRAFTISAYSSGSVREFHPIPFSSPKGENLHVRCKVTMFCFNPQEKP